MMLKGQIWSFSVSMQDFGDDCSSDCESDDNLEMEECTSESEVEDENDAGNEEWTSSNEAKTDCSDDDEADLEATAVEALKKLVPYNLEEFEKVWFFLECEGFVEQMVVINFLEYGHNPFEFLFYSEHRM